MTTPDLEKLLRPRSIALVGASAREHAAGRRVLRNLRSGPFPGRLYPVNPRYESLDGMRCYPSLASLPETVDAAFIAVPAEEALAVLEQAGGLGIPAALMNATGFADAGADGRARQERLVAIAARYGMAVCGPNNSGYINLWDSAYPSTYYAMPRPEPGPVAVITQSGSVGIALSQDDRRLGLGYIITTGNEAVLGVADYLRFVVGDDRIRVVMIFLEVIRDSRGFAAAAAAARRRGKTVIVVKVGSSDSGRAAVSAHSGALAGEDRVCNAFLRRHGIVRAADLDEMVETAALFSAFPTPAAVPHVVPVTLSGGEAGLIADLGAEAGLSLPPLAADTAMRLQPLLSPFFLPRNPLDAMGLGWDRTRFGQVLSILLDDPQVGTVAMAADASASGLGDALLVGEAAECCAGVSVPADKRIVFFTNTAAGGVNPQVAATLAAAGIPMLCGMRAAIGALRHWSQHRPPAPPPGEAGGEASFVAGLAGMAEGERFAALSGAGVPMVRVHEARGEDDAVAAAESFGYPVVVKGSAADLPHKSEHELVRLGLADSAAVREAYRAVAAALRRHSRSADAAVIVQPMIAGGVELIVGLRNDPSFGPVIVAGLGGILTEILDEASVRLAPVDAAEARDMLAETRAAAILAGVRGRGPFDLDVAAEAIAALSRLHAGMGQALAAVEINPLIVRERGRGAVGVDLLVEPLSRPDTKQEDR
ncbi:MAG: acetate--CoA ligase family protein [Acidisphaera sp.]|nr:acetate--CoA ligase family protein [Acidisphaera sp.]